MIGVCSARVTVAGHHTSVMFYVLEHCPHDLILGLDFLSEHSALIDCSAGVVQLALPTAVDPPGCPPSRLCSADHLRLPPRTVTYVGVSPVPPVPDGDYIVSPNLEVLLSQNVAFPHTLVTITDNASCLPLVNFGLCPQVLPRGISLAEIMPAADCHISTLSYDRDSCAEKPSPTTPSDQGALTQMIAPDLPTQHADELRALLASFWDIFDHGDRKSVV